MGILGRVSIHCGDGILPQWEVNFSFESPSHAGNFFPGEFSYSQNLQNQTILFLKATSESNRLKEIVETDVDDNLNQSYSEEIWNRYFQRLLSFAKVQMKGMPKVTSDEEDITLSVLKSVCLSLRNEASHFGRNEDGSDLWGLLVLICKRKIANLYAYQNRLKRDVSKSESLNDSPGLLNEIQSREIRPEFLAEFNERVELLFSSLEKDMLKEVAMSKVQGYTNEEIAQRLGCSLSTIERKLRLIREIWSREGESSRAD